MNWQSIFTQSEIQSRDRFLTKYRLSDHSLAIEKGRYKKAWLPRDQRICGHCTTGEVETEMHFLLHCPKYEEIRQQYFSIFAKKVPNFSFQNDNEKLAHILGEIQNCNVAAKYVAECHTLRDSENIQ